MTSDQIIEALRECARTLEALDPEAKRLLYGASVVWVPPSGVPSGGVVQSVDDFCMTLGVWTACFAANQTVDFTWVTEVEPHFMWHQEANPK